MRFAIVTAVLLVLVCENTVARPDAAGAARPLPLRSVAPRDVWFEPNLGQAPDGVLAVARTGIHTVRIAGDRVEIGVAGGDELHEITLRFEGARRGVLRAGAQRAGRAHYLKGRDPQAWVTDVPMIADVVVENVYEGTSCRWHAERGPLEFDFTVAAGAEMPEIRIRADGAGDLLSAPDGGLLLRAGSAIVRLSAPRAWQPSPQEDLPVSTWFRLEGTRTVSLVAERIDPALPLVVDPQLFISTEIGGRSEDAAAALEVDPTGAVWVAGRTSSSDFPTTDDGDETLGGLDGYVMKIDPATPEVLFATFVGGSGLDFVSDLEIDGLGRPVLAGGSWSTDFPGVVDVTSPALSDAFVLVLSASGASIERGARLGGESTESAGALALLPDGRYAIGGGTGSRNFPTTGGQVTTPDQRKLDGFVCVLNPALDRIDFSTYFASPEDDHTTGVVGDATGAVYAAGWTSSFEFPTTPGIYQTGGNGGFYAKILPDENRIEFAGLVGMNVSAIAVDAKTIVLAGDTSISSLPTTSGAFQGAGRQGWNAYLLRVRNDGADVVAASYFGGTDDDFLYAMAFGSDGRVRIAGTTKSPSFPLVGAFQERRSGPQDAFVATLSDDLTELEFASFLGGTDWESVFAVATDGSGNTLVAGTTYSADFPVRRNFATEPASSDVANAFLVRIADGRTTSIGLDATRELEIGSGETGTIVLTVTNLGASAAGDVLVRMSLPAEAHLTRATQDTHDVPILTWGTDTAISLGEIAAGSTAHVAVTIEAFAPVGARLAASARVTSSAAATPPPPRAVTIVVTAPRVPPPTVTEVRFLDTPGRPFRVKIAGENFQPGVAVFAGETGSPVSAARRSARKLVLKKGPELEALFPPGEPVTLRLVNPDGGRTVVEVTR